MLFTHDDTMRLIAQIDNATPDQLRAALKAVLQIQPSPVPDTAGLSEMEKALLNDGFATFQHAMLNATHDHLRS